MGRDFPTRQVLAKHIEERSPLRSFVLRAARAMTMRATTSESPTQAAADSPDSPLLAMVLGLDPAPRKMKESEVQKFGDPFTQQFILKNIIPLTLVDLNKAVDQLKDGEARPLRKVYAVAEGASFQSITPPLEMNTRLVITWQKDAETAPDLLLSTVVSLNDPESLMQLIAWSETQGVYHFFQRKAGVWAWAGSSLHALARESRGQGPFDSHINGGLVMKELKFPWVNWHSQANSIPRELIFPSPQDRSNALFAQLEGGEVLEAAVRAGVRRWTKRRVARDLSGATLQNLDLYARQIVWTTSINLTSTGTLSRRLDSESELTLPRTFFFDEDGLREAASLLSTVDILPPHDLVVDSKLYATSLRTLGVHVTDGDPSHSVKGDTEFAFTVTERAFEDLAVIQELMAREVLSPRLALCLLMVDFSNPVFSPERAALLQLFPPAIAAGNGGAALDSAVANAATAASLPAAKQLLALMNDANLVTTVQKQLADFADAVQKALRNQSGIDQVTQLADSRKEAFRHRKLSEFPHSTAMTRAPVAHLAMRADATIFTKVDSTGEDEK